MGKKKVKVKSNKNSPLEEVRKKNPLLGRGWGGSSPSSGGVGEASASKILIIQQKMIGDVLASSLICENLKLNYPEAEVHYVVNRFTIPVIENNPYIDEIVVFEEEYRSNKFAFYKFLKHIRQSNYDVVIDAYGKLESNLITLCSGAEIKIGWEKSLTKFIYTHPVGRLKQPQSEAGLAIEDRLNLLSPLQLDREMVSRPKIHLTIEELAKAKLKLQKFSVDFSKPIFMIGILGSESSKTYPLQKMAKVLDCLVEKTDGQLLFNYMLKQRKKAVEAYKLCKPSTQNKIHVDLLGNSLREFMALTYQCDALLGNEGGAVNMAKALFIPTFTIFSPWINPLAWASFEDGKHHMSIHLKELKPSFYSNVNFKELKPKSERLYYQLDEGKVIKSLSDFLKFYKSISK
jgi:heptosyltransferase-2